MLSIDIILTLQIIADSRNKRQLVKAVYEADFKKITGLQPLLAFTKKYIAPDATYTTVETALAQAQKIKADSRSNNIHIITPDDIHFPPSLKVIDSPPVLLFAKGDLSSLTSGMTVVIIGTREVSPFGAEMSKNIARQLALRGITIVSGLALGSDTAAHQGCLEERGKTIAVLAHGLKMVYPHQNERLANEIVRSGGCLLSEYTPDVRPTIYSFVERDRLQSGLSHGVIVIESAVSGGAMHTAHFAQAQSKRLACVKHPSDFPERYPAYKSNTAGNALLLKEGAFQLESLDSLPNFVSELERPNLKRERSDDKTHKSSPVTKKSCRATVFSDSDRRIPRENQPSQTTLDSFLR